ncbi:MAG: YggU family protein [Nitrospirae bacterium]|nr:YggU family protein [Nitrospirota bacterium]
MDIPYKKTKNGITIEIKVEPRSSQRGIAGVMDNSVLKVKLTSPPVEGAANEQLIEVMAEELKVKRSQVKVIRGHSSKRKVVEISGVWELS